MGILWWWVGSGLIVVRVENIVMVGSFGALIIGVERYVKSECVVLWWVVVGKMVKRNCCIRQDWGGVVGGWLVGWLVGWLMRFLVFAMRGWCGTYEASLGYVMSALWDQRVRWFVS